jgi:type 1 fimbriae regulatory protein FimB/type 1 fimbriae regulatory protein FimE
MQWGFRMTKQHLRLIASRAVNGTVPPRRVPNAELRTREYLDEFEIERLMRTAKANRNGQRDATMILIAFRHGLRPAELVDLRWDQVDLGRNACLHVRRVKNGMPSVHPLQGDEMRALRELKRSADSPFVFVSERGAPFTRAGFAKMIARLGVEAKFKFGVHPHMLRHACGYALANRGHDTRALQAYLGHKNIQHTVRYTELSPTRFKDFWRK